MNNKVGRAARANMARKHQEANFLVKITAFNEFLEETRVAREEMDLLVPYIKEETMSMLGLRQMFGVTLMDPRAVAGISSIDTGRKSSKDEQVREPRRNAAFAAPYGVPPLFAPRDNGHRQSTEDLEKLEALILDNKYVVPEHTENRWGSPVWPEGAPMVDGRHADAGQWGKLCYRTACQKPNAFFYNKGTHKHYCQKCADDIDRENMGGYKLHHLAEYEGQPAPV